MSKKYWNEEMETLSPERFHDVQEKALLKQLKYVYANSVFYQEKFKKAGVGLSDIRTLEDLAKLPFTEKSELRESQLKEPPLGLHRACAKDKVKRIYSTSGTTGRPTFIGLTKHDLDVWTESACRAFWTGGLREDSIVPLVVAPYFIAGSYADALETVGMVVPLGVGATDRLIAAYQHIGANALLCTTSFPILFADSLKKRGIDPKSLGIRQILGGGEPGASIPSLREQVEAEYGCRFTETMGNGDMCGEMWSECEYKHGMHFISQGIIHPEIIDPDTGVVQEIKKGARGELVYTSIDRECIPLVRFRTRDHVEVTQTECECGRTGYGIRVFGRTDDMIIVQGVNVYPAAVRDIVASLTPKTTGAMEIQIYQAPPEGWKPPIHIKAEHGKGVTNLDALKKEIENLLRDKLVFRANVELVPPDALPKFEYKAKLVRKVYEEEKK